MSNDLQCVTIFIVLLKTVLFISHVQTYFEFHVIVQRDKFLIMKPTRCRNLLNFIFGLNLYIFRTVPLSIIRSFFSLYTLQWYMSYRFTDSLRAGAFAPARKLSANLYDIYHCCVYREKKTPDGGQRNCPKHIEFQSKNKI